jgi:SAM-dependent methyltransferase
MSAVLRDLCPPLVWRSLRRVRAAVSPTVKRLGPPSAQHLAPYWTPEMARLLDTWGDGNVWNEIQLLLCEARGRVLDIACGTGKAIEILGRSERLELHGCDISDFLIAQARQRGIPAGRLRVADAARLDYDADAFAHAYSIGSLEHFTEAGLSAAIAESARVSAGTVFHMVPVSRSGRDEGWMQTTQAFYNNSATWWEARFGAVFPRVQVIDSAWSDDHSLGCWFVCRQSDR